MDDKRVALWENVKLLAVILVWLVLVGACTVYGANYESPPGTPLYGTAAWLVGGFIALVGVVLFLGVVANASTKPGHALPPPPPAPQPRKPVREPIPSRLRWQVLDRDRHRCVYCGRSPQKDGVTLHLDHKVPVSRGGRTTFENLVTACDQCNLGKSNRPVTDG